MADISLTCPKCSKLVNVPIAEDVQEFVCTHCGERSPIQQSLDAFTTVMKDPLIGAVISECEVEAKVGEGGFGAVYRAFDRNLQRHVALKVMLQSLTSNLEFVQKFIREAVTAAQLNHPNIVAIHKVGRDEDRNVHYLIMEFLEGRTLADLIDERGALPLDEAIAIILQCADALAVAHDKKIVHRDIKPENVMIDRHGVVKITDFGLAKTVTTDMKSTKVVGTPHYMSPEQFEGKAVDGRTDIYSLGITFYYMLTRAKPYEGTNTVQIIYSILTQEPRPLNELNPELPEEIWRVVRKMIAKRLDERYADFREVRRDLLAFQERSLAQKIACPQCQAVNVRGRRFCRECGASLLVKCPQCGHEDVAGTRHCGQCGAGVEGLLRIREGLDRGSKLRGFGDLKRALAVYQEVLKLDPSQEEATRATRELESEIRRIDSKKAEIDDLVKDGKADEALQAVEELLASYPRVEDVKTYGHTVRRSLKLRAVDAHLLVVDKALAEGRLEDAIESYGKALEVDPERTDVMEKRAELRARVEAFGETLKSAENALAKGRHVDALNAANELLRLKPDHARARAIHNEAKTKVESIESFVSEGRRLLEARDYDLALTRLETAHEISPADEEVNALLDAARRGKARVEEKLSLIRRLLAEEAPDQALAGAEELLAEKPGHPAATQLAEQAREDLARKRRAAEVKSLVERGRKFEGEGDLAGAREAYVAALEIDPEHAKALNLKTKVDAAIAETKRLTALAAEHERDGAFAQATAVLNQLRELLPKDATLAKRADEVRRKMELVDAGLRRADDALRRKRYDLAVKAAEEVLAIAPHNGPAQNAKRDAERSQAAVAKHLEEARGLIASELFDDAIAELGKALEKGAADEDVAPLRQAAEEGKVNLLKSEATRSFVFKDFAAAIERYEAVLAVEREDADAQKGIRLARRMMRAREREGVFGKALAAVVLLAGMFLVQHLAAGVGGEMKVAAAEPATTEAPVVEAPAPPGAEELARAETSAGLDPERWANVSTSYEKHAAEFADVLEIRQGREFAPAFRDALSISPDRPSERLAALRVARDRAGDVRTLRQPRLDLVDQAIEETVERWLDDAARLEEAGDWAAAVESYDRMVADETIARSHAEFIERNRQFPQQMKFAQDMAAAGNYMEAVRKLREVGALEASDPRAESRRAAAARRLEGVREEWIGATKRRIEAIRGDAADDAERLAVVRELARIAELFEMSPEDLYRRVAGR